MLKYKKNQPCFTATPFLPNHYSFKDFAFKNATLNKLLEKSIDNIDLKSASIFVPNFRGKIKFFMLLRMHRYLSYYRIKENYR